QSVDNSDHDSSTPYTNDVASLASGLIDVTATATITDSDGDIAVSNKAVFDLGGNVQFGDDGPKAPTITLSSTDPILLTFDGGLSGGKYHGTDATGDQNPSFTIATQDFSAAFSLSNTGKYGADGAGSTTVTYALQFASGFDPGDSHSHGDATGLT